MIDVSILTESNNNGFIEKKAQQAAFNALVNNIGDCNLTGLVYTWTISDSTGAYFTDSQLLTYKNSIAVPKILIKANQQYIVEVQVTDGNIRGSTKMVYGTDPVLPD
jgi:hypothetical protein